MNLNRQEAVALVEQVLSQLPAENSTEIVFSPSFVHLYKVSKMCKKNTNVFTASQDCSAHENGAFTGEVSANMIASCNARYIVLGHSERRVNFKESNHKPEFDHIHQFSDGGLTVKDNLMPLCKGCHAMKTAFFSRDLLNQLVNVKYSPNVST